MQVQSLVRELDPHVAIKARHCEKTKKKLVKTLTFDMVSDMYYSKSKGNALPHPHSSGKSNPFHDF